MKRRVHSSVLPPVALALALGLGGCCDDECATTPGSDARAEGGGGDAAPSECQTDKVQCKADELNAFGVCLAQSSMVKVPAGEFTMGHTEHGKDYNPEHKVTLKEYLIDKTEVTVAQYKACVDCGVCAEPLRDGSHTGREPYYGNAKFADYPVIHVSWKDAKAYCEGIGKRLPTEAEWEKAARGTNGDTFPWGTAAPTSSHANYAAKVNDTAPVTDYDQGKSPYGALNMAGNVWEWVADSYDATYYSKSPAADPPGPTSSVVKVMRGGGFISSTSEIATYTRGHDAEGAAFSTVGFRCAKDKW
jgi:formylglycine-generating enzyme required for sulfatase activity